MINFPLTLFEENRIDIRKELGYKETEDTNPIIPHWQKPVYHYAPINDLHTLYEKIYRDYNTLYGVEYYAAQKAASDARFIASMDEKARADIDEIIALTKEWIRIVEERIKKPGNTSYNPFSKKVVLPEDIKRQFSELINSLKNVIDDVQKESTPKTYDTERGLINIIRSIYDAMKSLAIPYPRLYRAFDRIEPIVINRGILPPMFIDAGSLKKANGKNLFESGKSGNFLQHLSSIRGGKRKTKRTKKQKRRRTIRR